MIQDRDRALKIAEFLLQIKAVKLQPKNPFTWASGWNSPIYCDNRVTLSYPSIRTYIRQGYAEAIEKEETLRWELEAARLDIEIWRSREATNRNQDRAHQ